MEFKFHVSEIRMGAPWQCVTDDELLQKQKQNSTPMTKPQTSWADSQLSALLKGSNCFTEVNFLQMKTAVLYSQI